VKLVAALRCVGTAFVLLAGCHSVFAQDDRPLALGTHAPAFRANGLDGKPLSLRSLRGKVVLVDFWATWCGPCRAEVPEMRSLYQQFSASGLHVVGISLDDTDSVGDVPQFVKDKDIPYEILVSPDGNQAISTRYHAPHPPVQYLIDRRGVIRWSRLGYGDDDPAILRNLVKKLIAEKA